MSLFDRLNKETKKTRSQMENIKVQFHQDNAPSHKSMKTRVKLKELFLKLLCHPTYSPHVVPCNDCWLHAELKRMLQGNRFDTNKEVIVEVEA